MPDKPSYSELKKIVDEQKKHIDSLVHQISELRHLAVLVQDSNDAITVQDLEGNIIVWNNGAQKMYGWSEKQALQMNISQIVPPDKAEEALGIIKKILAGKAITSFETKRLTADGRILDVWLTVTALVDEKSIPTHIATTERDITAQKHAIKEKTELIKQLQNINAQLQKSLAETRTLRGIIPICMLCKKIRNDKGFWEQVEVYVHNHTAADFSHGICPECLKTKFPKIYQKKLLNAPVLERDLK